jgi:hypothetical protein
MQQFGWQMNAFGWMPTACCTHFRLSHSSATKLLLEPPSGPVVLLFQVVFALFYLLQNVILTTTTHSLIVRQPRPMSHFRVLLLSAAFINSDYRNEL